MSDLDTQFQAAVANSKSLSERPDNPTLLKIYGLYKQATEGDNGAAKPGFSDLVGRAKWDAWNANKGKSADDAKQAYIDLIDSLS
ncbi:MAG: acyl-CoA-binding protein [Burkholderiales bacterium]|jgi:acyl-CoA-binding protein|nr:acyl-CoA-binding protein [Burkholderiales bacterium]